MKYVALSLILIMLAWLNSNIIIYNGLNKGIVVHTNTIHCGLEIVPNVATFCGDY